MLVISTKNICEKTWGKEIELWNLPLTYHTLSGRRGDWAAANDADVVSINFESLEWLLDAAEAERFTFPEVLVIDESSKMKSPSAKRVKRFIHRRSGYVECFSHRWLLSATPAPEGYEGLWAQEACATTTRPLGENITAFRGRYCVSHWNGFGFKYSVPERSQREIEHVLKDFLRIPKLDPHLAFPDPIFETVMVPWQPKARDQYEQMRDELETLVLSKSGKLTSVEAIHAGAVIQKLRQLCSGFLYDSKGGSNRSLDPTAKIRALRDVQDRSADTPLLVFTQFREEMSMLNEAFPEAHIGMPKSLDAWDAGDLPMLVLNPKSAGHGLNLQYGSHICVYYSKPYSYDEWFQSWGRLARRGQTQMVSVISLERPDSICQVVSAAVARKEKLVNVLVEHMRGE